jgi:hypothetical protein
VSAELAEAGFDSATSPIQLDEFLRRYASAFYAAASSQEALRGNLEMKLLGAMVSRLDLTVDHGRRVAEAAEQMVDLLRRFLADRSAESALVEAGRALQAQGLPVALHAYELLTGEMQRAGYDLGVGSAGAASSPG